MYLAFSYWKTHMPMTGQDERQFEWLAVGALQPGNTSVWVGSYSNLDLSRIAPTNCVNVEELRDHALRNCPMGHTSLNQAWERRNRTGEERSARQGHRHRGAASHSRLLLPAVTGARASSLCSSVPEVAKDPRVAQHCEHKVAQAQNDIRITRLPVENFGEIRERKSRRQIHNRNRPERIHGDGSLT
jgi:hypothetical protein